MRACKVDRLRAGSLGKEPARDARGGERESNCGAARRRRCSTPPAVVEIAVRNDMPAKLEAKWATAAGRAW